MRKYIIGEVLTHADPNDKTLPKAFYKAGENDPQPIPLVLPPQQYTPPFGTPLTITFTPPIPCSSIANPQFTVTASIPAPPSLGTLQQLLETPPTLASDTPASTFAESTGSANRRPLLLMSQQDVAARTIAPPTAEAQGAENKTPKTPKKEEVRRPGGKK